MEKIKVVIVEPGKEAEIREIDATLETYQAMVGGYIECIYPFDDPVGLVCNEEGKNNCLPPNRCLLHKGKPYDVIAGTFFVVGLGEEDFISLTDDLAEKYRVMYEQPEFLYVYDIDGIRMERRH